MTLSQAIDYLKSLIRPQDEVYYTPSDTTLRALWPGTNCRIQERLDFLGVPPNTEVTTRNEFDEGASCVVIRSPQTEVRLAQARVLKQWMEGNKYDLICNNIRQAATDFWYYHNAI